MTIDLCVINHQTKDKLQRLLSTLLKKPDITGAYHLYVADNGSTDGSVELLHLWVSEHPNILPVLNPNVGYAAACNQLADMSYGDIIGLLNADTWFTLDDVLAIQQTFDEHPEISILGPKQRDERGHITHGGIFGPNDHPVQRGWHVHDPEDTLYRELEECLTVSGSAYFIRRLVWEELTKCPIYQDCFPGISGAFAPFVHYFEETLCSYHAQYHGYKVFFAGHVSGGHSWHASSPMGSTADQQFPISQAGFRFFCDAHGISHD